MKRRWLVLVALVVLIGLLGLWRYDEWREHRFDGLILQASRRYGVEPALIKAVMWRESWFNPNARGRAGELGLMQIRAAAAGEWATAEKLDSFASAQLIDPETNALVGAWYLAKLLKRYRREENPVPYALADYNAGRSNALRWSRGDGETNAAAFIARIDFPGTRRYVDAVVQRMEKYQPTFEAVEKSDTERLRR